MNLAHRQRRNRKGTTAVEAAFVLPVFFVFLFFFFQYGHAQMTNNTLQAACRTAARFGANEGVSSADVEQHVKQMLAAAIDPNEVAVIVKDASLFDEDGDLPESPQDYENLPDIELTQALPRQMFIVRATVPYGSVALLNLPWMGDVILSGQAISRHE